MLGSRRPRLSRDVKTAPTSANLNSCAHAIFWTTFSLREFYAAAARSVFNEATQTRSWLPAFCGRDLPAQRSQDL